jgi:epsin
VTEATSNDLKAPSPHLLQELAVYAQNLSELDKIMSVVWRRLDHSGHLWRHPYKCQTLFGNKKEKIFTGQNGKGSI